MDDTPRIAELRKKLDKDPASRLFAQLAEELRKEGRHEDAISVVRKGLEKSPNYPSARLTLARALLDAGRPGEARPELEQIVKASPDNILASRLLGEALQSLGESAQAIQQFERTLQLSPSDKSLLERTGELKRSLAPPRPSAPDPGLVPTIAATVAPLPSVLPEVPLPSVFPEVAMPASPEVLASSPVPQELPAVLMPTEGVDPGGQTLPLTSMTLADLYLQQGLKAEASAVLSQVLKDEPENVQAKSKFAAVEGELAQNLPGLVPPVAVQPEAEPRPSPRPKSKTKEQSILSLKAFLNAVEREAVQQRATEIGARP